MTLTSSCLPSPAELYSEVKQMRAACGEAHLKVILAVGECGSLTTVYKVWYGGMTNTAIFGRFIGDKEEVTSTTVIRVTSLRGGRDVVTNLRVGKDGVTILRVGKDGVTSLCV